MYRTARTVIALLAIGGFGALLLLYLLGFYLEVTR